VGEPLIVHISGEGEILATREYSPGDIIICDKTGGFIRIRIEEDSPDGPPWERQTTLYVQRQDEAGQALWPEKLEIVLLRNWTTRLEKLIVPAESPE